jgi:hypothetical protein
MPVELSGAATRGVQTTPERLAEIIRNARRPVMGQPTPEQIQYLQDLTFSLDDFVVWLESEGGSGSLEAWVQTVYPQLGQFSIPGDYLLWYAEGVFACNVPRRMLPLWMREFNRQLDVGAGTALEIARRLAL